MRQPPNQRDDDEVEIVPIPLDRASLARLARLSRATGKRALDLAGDLLADVLRDDEEAHRPSNLN